MLRAPAEVLFADELEQLVVEDKYERPPRPGACRRGPSSPTSAAARRGAKTITPKYIGHQRLVEIAISTLVTDRALLLLGEPGTAKSWLSEHLAAAINGDSTQVVQGTAGTTEEQIRYTWTYAMLIAHGPSNECNSSKKPHLFAPMETGTLARFEEITRCARGSARRPHLAPLRRSRVSVPELATEVPAARGFSVIATANTRHRGVNARPAARTRRFTMVVLPSPANLDTEVDIVRKRVAELAVNLELKASVPADEAIPASRHDFPRTASRPDARRQEQAQGAVGVVLVIHRGGRSLCWPTAWPWRTNNFGSSRHRVPC